MTYFSSSSSSLLLLKLFVLILVRFALFLFFSQHRAPMKKVRKSLALDVMDCQVMPTSKRKAMKTEAKHSIKVRSKK